MKLEFFIKCRIKFILIYLQFICNINQQRTNNKIKIFYTKKINILCSHFQQINRNLGIVGDGLILIFNLNWIFHNILNNFHLLIYVISTINSTFFFFNLFIKSLTSGIFNLQFNNLLQVLIEGHTSWVSSGIWMKIEGLLKILSTSYFEFHYIKVRFPILCSRIQVWMLSLINGVDLILLLLYWFVCDANPCFSITTTFYH